eukprot:13901-Pyramimonas_sp.AAC.1
MSAAPRDLEVIIEPQCRPISQVPSHVCVVLDRGRWHLCWRFKMARAAAVSNAVIICRLKVQVDIQYSLPQCTQMPGLASSCWVWSCPEASTGAPRMRRAIRSPS